VSAPAHDAVTGGDGPSGLAPAGGGAVASGLGPPTTADPAADSRPALEEIARGIDRQLEGLRAVVTGSTIADDPVATDVRRSGAAVASRCATVVLRGSGEAAETARCLAAISALAVLGLDALGSDGVAPATGGAPERGVGDADDVVRVLGDAVTERYRTLVRTAVDGPAAPMDGGLPIELFLRQLGEHAPDAASWQAMTIWTAMALKVAEAARWWPAVDAPRPTGGAPA